MADATAGSAQKGAAHSWPPVVYFILGVVCLLMWAGGTAMQVQTSEAWILGAQVKYLPTLSTFLQIWLFITGQLPGDQIVPFGFAWGVQLALIVASVGVEMPKHPKWRYYLSWAVVVVLIGVNSAGDYNYSAQYGGWGQLGFTVVILFVTFCLGLLAIICFTHGFKRMQGQ